MKKKVALILLVALVAMTLLVACGQGKAEENTPAPTPAPVEDKTPAPAPAPVKPAEPASNQEEAPLLPLPEDDHC